jgi:hypothetical protein
MGHLYSNPKQEEEKDEQDVLSSEIQKLKHDIQIQKNQNIEKWFKGHIHNSSFKECILNERVCQFHIYPLPIQVTKEEIVEWIQSKQYQYIYKWMVLTPQENVQYYTIQMTDTARQDYHEKTKLKLQKYWNSYFKKQIPGFMNFMKEKGCTSCEFYMQEFMEKHSIPVLTNTIFDEFLQHPHFDVKYNQKTQCVYITLN